MTQSNKNKIKVLLKGIETGDPESVKVVNEDKYIQHNPLTAEGSEGLANLFKRLSKMSPKVSIIRIFEDGDFVFAHTDYDFNVREVCFEVFRFEEGFAVEHWDNLQDKAAASNTSNHTMIDGAVTASELDKTEVNREFIRSFVDKVLINRKLSELENFISIEDFVEHNPRLEDGITSLHSALSKRTSNDNFEIRYETLHHLLAEGDFVLSICEGYLNEVHSSFYDLYRISNGKVVEHWDTTDVVPLRSEWKNENGKF